MSQRLARNGFSLIELAIVLLIIGLVTSGILIGKDLIRAAELRSIITEADNFKLAINTFRVKYNAVPGDMGNAEDIWGSDDDCPDYSSTPDTPKVPTCNGNGDGLIRDLTNSTEDYEVFRAIQHLSNAQMIAGIYTGVRGPEFLYDTQTGLNIPKLKSFNAGMLAVHNDADFSGDHLYHSAYRLMIHIGSDDLAGGWNHIPFLTPAELFYIDSKADDGKPGTGIWRSYIPASYADPEPPHCATTDNQQTALYDLSHEARHCGIVFIVQRD